MPTAQRIAFVCPRFAEGPTVGGAETLLKQLALRAQAAGRQVTFLTTCARNHFTWQNEAPPGLRPVDGLPVHFFPVDDHRDLEAFLKAQDRISRKTGHTPEDEQAWLRNSVNSRALQQHLAEHGDDYDRIVMGPYLFGLVYFAAGVHPAKTRLVPCLHDEGFAYARAFRDMFLNAGGILFNSEPERALALRLYGVPAARTAVVGMGLDPFEASPAAFAARRGVLAPYVMYCGRREAGKGVPLLLDYLALFRERTGRDVKLVLTGTGPIDPPPGLAAHVVDVGFVSEQEKHEAMAGAVALCHPSVNESFSIVLLEAWLARTAALVHAACAVTRQHCERSNGGLWFQMYPDFEEALLRLLDDPRLRRALGAAGRAYVEREYTWPVIERKLLEALDR